MFFCVFAAATAKAASLYGKVIEVNSGDVITIFNLNRPVRVKLLGVDAPEMNQSFGDVAKKHLYDLVFDKGVLVNYSGIAADKSLTGRVSLNDVDIGAQMIRDGAAWFDLNNMDRLSASDREVYQQSEQAARSEKRGLWQQANPVAPWEFVKAENAKKNPAVSLNKNEASLRVRPDGLASELTNFSLMTRNVKAAEPSASASVLKRELIDGAGLPSGLPFTAFPPPNGTRIVKSIAFGSEVVKTNQYIAWEGRNLYSVAWFTAQTYGEDDHLALDQFIFNEYMAGVAGALTGGDPKARCHPQSEKDVSANGYFGVELDLSLCPMPTRIRAFTKTTGDKREVYFAAVTFQDEDANVTRFLKTFTMSHKKAQKAQKENP
ncbi:MAG TPA: thermonuclease family protein [Pyrinomonadaceae bacterium]|nr:thermonuclease family protein [Pyrinomonadaceae bacterium]